MITRAAMALLLLSGRCGRERELTAAEQVEDSSALTLPHPVPPRGDQQPIFEPAERCSPAEAVDFLFSLVSPVRRPPGCP